MDNFNDNMMNLLDLVMHRFKVIFTRVSYHQIDQAEDIGKLEELFEEILQMCTLQEVMANTYLHYGCFFKLRIQYYSLLIKLHFVLFLGTMDFKTHQFQKY